MDKRTLGRSGIAVAPLMFGGDVLGWTADEATSFALLDAFLAAGFNAIDTADMYSSWAPGHQGGESETVLGKWLKARGGRDRVVIATKVGLEMAYGSGLKAAHIATAVEHSLKRLQTDYIDLYQSHIDDSDTALIETLAAYDKLIKAGKVRAIGASNYGAPRLAEALAISAANGLPRYETLQPSFNFHDRAYFENVLQPLCVKEQIGVIPYQALASGFFTGKYRSANEATGRAREIGIKKYADARGFKILAAVESVAKRLGGEPAQVTLAWAMAQPAISAPIASARNTAQLAVLMKAVQMKLDAAAIEAIDDACKY